MIQLIFSHLIISSYPDPPIFRHFIWLEHCFHMEFSKNKVGHPVTYTPNFPHFKAIAVNCYYDLANHYGIKKFDGWRAAAGHERTWVRALGFFLFNYPVSRLIFIFFSSEKCKR